MAKDVIKYSDNIKTIKEDMADKAKDTWLYKTFNNTPLEYPAGIIQGVGEVFAGPFDFIGSAIKTKGQTAYPSYAQFHDAYNTSSYKNTSINDYLNLAANYGLIDKDIYKDAIKSLEKFEQIYGPATGAVVSQWLDFWSSTKSKKEVAKLYEAMTGVLPTLEKINDASLDDLKKNLGDALASNTPVIAGPSAPTYNQVRTGTPAGYPVGPVPLWTGQELADLNNTNWNPEYYYDLIKAGTTAAVARDRFGVDQRDYASTSADDRARASYLDNIRNVKSEAITAGATRGARAANEMLATRENAAGYADNQNKVRQENYESMLNSLLADASARLTARDYFTNLAENRYNEGTQFYANDTDAQGQELLTDAELYSADMQDRAQALYANALMDQAYAQNAANANVARGGINNTINEYLQMLEIATKANGGNVAQGAAELGQVISAGYTNQNSLKNFANAVNK